MKLTIFCLRINQGPTVTFMWHAKSQAKPQTYSNSHCFIIKPQPTWRYWHCLKPVSTMWRWSSQKRTQLCRGAQTRFHLSYVCQDTWTIPEWLFGWQIVRKSAKGRQPVREIGLQWLLLLLLFWLCLAAVVVAAVTSELHCLLPSLFCLVNTVRWASGRAFGLWKLSDEMLVWFSVWSEVQIVCIWSSWCHRHPQTTSSLASFKSRLVLPFWYRLTQVVLE